ncbi:MAG TPA: methyltransferase [Flavobacterium sp.]|nr:methyltransferase [Flavobacterium sp.]HPJ11100.1 methyltransferase [Flavobacterium sp.]
MKAIVKRIISPILQRASAIYLRKRRKYSYNDLSVWVEPTVFPPFITISTKLLLDFVDTLELKDKNFLELGCGCGIISILAAKKGAQVTATDINEVALEALRKNALDNQAILTVLKSDLFEKLSENWFDVVVINPPYYPKKPKNMAENAWFCGENFEYFERLFTQLRDFSNGNEIYMILSDDCDLAKIKAIALKNEMALDKVLEKKVATEVNFIFRLVSL